MNTADLNRRLENMIRLGTIAEVDHDARKVRVDSGTLTTDWLPWPAEIGKNFRRWRPLREGTGVIIACVSGDTAQAYIIGMLYTESIPTPSTEPNIDLIEFEDGTRIEYDTGNSKLTANS